MIYSILAWIAILLFSSFANAEITRIVIEKREVFAGGHMFGLTGAYEKLIGKAYGEVNPNDKHNTVIVNLAKAPKNARGRVEYSVDVYILKPVDSRRGNQTIFYDIVNRGSMSARFNVGERSTNDPSTLADVGDGFMMRQGYTLVWSAWQGDMMPGGGRLMAKLPIAKNPDGTSIQRRITAEYVLDKAMFSIPISYDRGSMTIQPYLPVEQSMSQAKLYRRKAVHASRELIPNEQWSFAECSDGKTKTASNSHICLPAGFQTDFIYELVYDARDPMVMGLGYAAIRDVMSYLRYNTSEGNPLTTVADKTLPKWTIAFGSSQSGRVMKDLIHLGFNQDEADRIVFDGAIPHISASRLTFTNYEFGMPGRFPVAVEGHFTPGDEFPFSYETQTDPVTKKTDGWLARCRETKSCPKIMHWDSASESWQGRNSLLVAGPFGEKDVPIPANVRLYYFASTQHSPAVRPDRGFCQQPTNPLSYIETQRALLVALQQWVALNVPPPPSSFPRISDGTLAPALPQSTQGFPMIPGVRYIGRVNDLSLTDRSTQPFNHVSNKEYVVLVPKVDKDGNDIAGIRSVNLQVPLATHTGWNLRAKGFIEDELCYHSGQYIPFPKTKAEREKNGDPRLSIEERYKDQADYVQQVNRAARSLVEQRLLLVEDAERIISEAARTGIFAQAQ